MNESNEQSNRSGGNNDLRVLKRTSKRNPIWLILFLLLFIGLVSFAVYRGILKAQVHSRLQKIKKSGSAVELAELDALYVTPPRGSNAADLYLTAFEKMVKGDTNSPQLPVVGALKVRLGTELTPESVREAASLIRSNQMAFVLLEEATKRKECRYPVQFADGYSVWLPLPHHTKIKSMTQLLQLRAIIGSETGDSTNAVKSIELILSLGNSIRREPCLISYLVRIGTVGINAITLEQALNRTAFSEEQLAVLQDVFVRSEDTNALSFAFTSERCFGINSYRNAKEYILTAGYQDSGGNEPISSVLLCGALQSVGFFDRDLMFYLDTLSGWIESAKLKHPERIDDFEEKFDVFIQNKKRRLPYIVSTMLLPSLKKVVQSDARVHAVARLSQIAAAVERFRIRHDNLPENLEQLIPAFLVSVPEDPFDGEPLRYQKTADGYQIYSVGKDRTDDGGRRHPKGLFFDEEGYDLTFVVGPLDSGSSGTSAQ